MFSRYAKVGAGFVATGAAVLYYRDDLRLKAATVFAEPPPAYTPFDKSPFDKSPHVDSTFPRSIWDSNWDFRDPLFLVDKKKYASATEEEQHKMLKEAKPTASRHLFFIRHGQYEYHDDSGKRVLTPLGKEQAKLLGKRLNVSDFKFDRCIYSTMVRATETAQIMMAQMKPLESKSDSILEEGAPYPPEPPLSHWRPEYRKFVSEGARIEAAFRRYVHRASPKQKEDSYELIVCHANVIRYFICRALQFPPEGWLRMSLGNSSITWMIIRPNGHVTLRAVGDIGHLPADKISFS